MPNTLVVGRDLMLGRPLTVGNPLTPRLSQVADPVQPTVQVFTGPADSTYDYGMLGNGPDKTLTVNHGNPVGDCGFAMFTHGAEIVALLLSLGLTPYQANAVVTAYLKYDHGKDVGVVLANLCHTLYTKGILGVKLKGYAQGTGRVEDEVTGITQHFGLSFCGIRVSQSFEDGFNEMQSDPGFVLEYKGSRADKTILGGHAVPSLAFDLGDGTIEVLTWAQRFRMTIKTLQVYIDEHYAPLYPQVDVSGIDGFDEELLNSLLAKVGPVD